MAHPPKIVIASDSFKGSLSSLEVADAVCFGIKTVCPDAEVVKVNVADGGEGTMGALVATLGGERAGVTVTDPLGRSIEAEYGLLGEGTAIVEMASASGLTLLAKEERNPLLTSTYGTGELIVDALKRGCRKIYVGIGGSATNDGGMGMLAALGYRFYDEEGQQLQPCGAAMSHVARIDATKAIQELRDAEFVVACDVDNPFCGLNGAAYVFAPQKGATPEDVECLDTGLRHFADKVCDFTGVSIADVPGAGAAGGLGGAFLAFLNARLVSGIDMVLDAIRFDEIIACASLVITGEGRIDRQTAMGKTPAGVLRRAKAQGIPVVAIGGSVQMCPEVETLGFETVVGVTPENMPLDQAMNPLVASRNIADAVSKVLFKYFKECVSKFKVYVISTEAQRSGEI